MSYCRWSTDNFMCDLYCYESTDMGFQTHVASRRRRMWYRAFVWLTDRRYSMKIGGIKITHRFPRRWVMIANNLTHYKIGLPHDGESFSDSTEQEMFDRVKYLKSLGYNAPDIWEDN